MKVMFYRSDGTWTWESKLQEHRPTQMAHNVKTLQRRQRYGAAAMKSYRVTTAAGKLTQLPGLGGKAVNFPSSPSETVSTNVTS
jgi:hypothetical protein